MMRSLLLFLSLTGLTFTVKAQNPAITTGKALFENNCQRCHGKDGTLGAFGAKNLRKSKLDDEKLVHKIANGGWIMPKWKEKLTSEQIRLIVIYIKTLRD